MTAKGFGGWFGLGLLAVVAAIAVGAAALLMLPMGVVGAQGAECRDNGIVPGSVKVVSSNNLAGELSGHTIRFQLCRNSESAAGSIGNGVDLARPAEIGLLWHDWFYLDRPEQAGITLTETISGKSWDAADVFAKRACSFRMEGAGVSIGFAGNELNALVTPGKDAPVTLQFDIPEAAGMLNPAHPDDYQWRIVLRYDQGDYWETYTGESVATVITSPLFAAAGISIFREFSYPGNYGYIGSEVPVVGHGFPPHSPVDSVQVGGVDVTPDNPAGTDAQGKFQLDVPVPGLESGLHILLVQVNGITATTIIIVLHGGSVSPVYASAAEALQNLGDNLVRAFHFNPNFNEWTFYDPEIPEDDSTLGHFMYLECYWILVKEPTEVILARQPRTFTCQPDGNCWNLIVW